MGRPKTQPAKKAVHQKPIVNRPFENAVNVIAEAIQTNRDTKADEGIVLGTSDFEGLQAAVNAKQKDREPSGIIELKEGIAPGEAERQRLLAQIREKFLSTDTTKPVFIAADTEQEIKSIPGYQTEEKINENLNKIKTALAEQNKPEPLKMTIEHYKVLKEHERFWLPFKLHGVLNGLNQRELDALANTMKQVFEPNYNLDFWCSYCIGEFLKDLYTHFEKWQETQKEAVTGYETLLQADKF